ncbi:MAG: tRNA uracil 4-sulfurtransferase ThiI [Bacillota bacterium]|nr:tRNA uracil 4-sulfurtransferase ThiI [Bacillota bacterium]
MTSDGPIDSLSLEQATSVLLCRIGEITLKGQNRRQFEIRVMQNLRARLRGLGAFQVDLRDSRIWVRPREGTDPELLGRAAERARTIFGIVSVSPALKWAGPVTPAMIESAAALYMRQLLERRPRTASFKVESRRGDKTFPLTSPRISAACGAAVLAACPELRVDVHRPEVTLYVELRSDLILYHEILPGSRGLPLGSSGRALLLLSGGIDSPVAGYMMASRGLRLEAVYFHTSPFTSDQAREKVLRLAAELSIYTGHLPVHVVDFTPAQLELNEKVPPEMLTVVMRRLMIRVADRLAERRELGALVTGESLGQVASQTLAALACTDVVSERIIFRPLIGLDKDATIEIAREIGTFETSILPYEDCCTIFVHRHPRVHPEIRHAEEAERDLDIETLVATCLEQIELVTMSPDAL